MPPRDAVSENALLMSLATTQKLSEAIRISSELHARYGYKWRPVGGRENNYGSINMGSDPGYALIERITNAIDAVVEREAAFHKINSGDRAAPRTPREAVEVWFNVPSGRIRNLDIPTRQTLAENVVISLLPSGASRQPTVRIRDLGIGLTPELMPDTILSLGESNKIDKLFLAGAYGQGGSTALAFSPSGTLFVSRRQPSLVLNGDKDRIAVTFARFRDLDPSSNKNGRYEYLVTPSVEVPSFPSAHLLDFRPGSEVIHFNMEIPRYAARLTQLTGSLWWLLQNALFDPILPIWAEDLRTSKASKGKPDRRSIAGNHSRLEEDARDRVQHADSVVVVLNDARGDSRIRVNYWVVREADDGNKRSRPIDAYVDPYAPVAYTYFGQTHGTDDRRFVTNRLSLPYLAKFLIIQVELDNLSSHARRALLSTTRDRLKQSATYDEMRERISVALAEDEMLIRLDHERKESLLSRHSDSERRRMRERFAKLMKQFRAGTDATAKGKGTLRGDALPPKRAIGNLSNRFLPLKSRRS